jgi:hypothetical protein
MTLEINNWTHHLNQVIYSYFYFCKQHNLPVKIICNKEVTPYGAILKFEDKTLFFDYSDDTEFMDTPNKYTNYFKRSLLAKDYYNNIKPLNFNVPLSYKCHSLLANLGTDILFDKSSRKEILRAIVKYSMFFSKSSHGVLDIRKYPNEIKDFGGNVIFHTRLWNPDNHHDKDEKERRKLQNEFRINACRIIKKKYRSASVGIFADDLSKKIARDLLLDPKKSNKTKYLKDLRNFNIGIADDGLKDTPGWKIGEYLLYGKAIITTPLTTMVDDFREDTNYEKLSSRSSFQELPDKIDFLLHNKKYLEVGNNNLIWSETYLHPKNYIQRILSVVNEENYKGIIL